MIVDKLRSLSRRISHSLFDLFEHLGFHITPVHFYSPIPDRRDLSDEVFDATSECIGINWNFSTQEHYLTNIFPQYEKEVVIEPNLGLSLVDAAVLHAMIRYHKPSKIVEIGSGSTTKISAQACIMNHNEGHRSELISIDPFPSSDVKLGFPGLSRLIQAKVEKTEIEELIDCDMLFIDSSHVVKMGGDVNYEILELAPRLKAGALIHWHDILLPGQYWKTWVRDSHYFWTEQYLLHAFLMFNGEFDIIWASRYMHLRDAERIRLIFPYFIAEQHKISSFWVKRKS